VHAFALVVLVAFALAPPAARAAETREASHFFHLSTGDLKAEAADARAEGKKGLLLFFEQEGCPGCLHMKRHVLNQASVQDYFRANFALIAVDILGAVPLRDFANRDYTEKSFAQALKVRGTPAFIFYDLAGSELVRIVGTIETADEFLLLGQFVTSGAYKTRSFARFKTEKLNERRKKTSTLAPSPARLLPSLPTSLPNEREEIRGAIALMRVCTPFLSKGSFRHGT